MPKGEKGKGEKGKGLASRPPPDDPGEVQQPHCSKNAPIVARNQPIVTDSVNLEIKDAPQGASNQNTDTLNFDKMKNVLNNSKDDSDEDVTNVSGTLPMADTNVSFAAIGELWETHRRINNDVIRHNVTGTKCVLNQAQLKLWKHKESVMRSKRENKRKRAQQEAKRLRREQGRAPAQSAVDPENSTPVQKRLRTPGSTPDENSKRSKKTGDLEPSPEAGGSGEGSSGGKTGRSETYSQVLKMISEPSARPLSFFIICRGKYRHLDQFDFQQISDHFFKQQVKETKDLILRLADEEHAFVDGGIRIDVKDLGCVDWWRKLIPNIPELDVRRGGYVFSANGYTPYAYLRTSCRMIPACEGTPAVGFVEGLRAINPDFFPESAPIVAWNVGEGMYKGMPHVVMLVKLPHVVAEKILRHVSPMRIGLNRLRFFPAAPDQQALPEELRKLFKTPEQESPDQDMAKEIPDTDTETNLPPPPPDTSFDTQMTNLEIVWQDANDRLEQLEKTEKTTNDPTKAAMEPPKSDSEID